MQVGVVWVEVLVWMWVEVLVWIWVEVGVLVWVWVEVPVFWGSGGCVQCFCGFVVVEEAKSGVSCSIWACGLGCFGCGCSEDGCGFGFIAEVGREVFVDS